MSIVSHAISAAALCEGGIRPALEFRAVVAMNARILGAVRYLCRRDPVLSAALDLRNVEVQPTMDEGRYLAVTELSETQVEAVERHLITLREETYELGFTTARVRRGFDMYALDAAMASVQAARDDINREKSA
jgi:hypothetical protein